MTANNQLALVVAYYLSRKDRDGYKNLGFASFNEATKEIGRLLGVKVNTIKNMRDEFDPYHDNNRVGWLRELRGSRLKVLQSFQETDDDTLLEIVKGILFDQEFRSSEEFKDIENLFVEKKNADRKDKIFVLRGPTGKKAESLFMEFFESNRKPVDGRLLDRRDDGCGYDFEILNSEGSWFIEIKGLTDQTGGVLFTNKEWKIAAEKGERYYLVLVSNISSNPEFKLINNPAQVLKAKKNIYTTVQINWSITDKEIRTVKVNV